MRRGMVLPRFEMEGKLVLFKFESVQGVGVSIALVRAARFAESDPGAFVDGIARYGFSAMARESAGSHRWSPSLKLHSVYSLKYYEDE